MQIQNYLKTKIINHNWKVHIEKCTFQQSTLISMKKPIIFLLVLITNILFISAQKISKTELKDKIAGAWIGQMVGNIYGLPFENKFVDEPAPESRFPFGYTKNIDKLQKYNGAFSDDDTDVEYIYLLLMEKYGVEPTYANMREGWMYHIRDRVWLANRAALGLMHLDSPLRSPVTKI